MILPIYASLERMDPSLIEAGKDLFGTPARVFLHVTLPQTKQGILAGCVLVFLPAVGDFVAAQLLGGPDTYMVGNLIQEQFFAASNWPFGSALTVVMMLFLSIWMFGYLRSAAREAREPAAAADGSRDRNGEPKPATAKAAGRAGLRPPALPPLLQRPRLPLPVRADRGRRPVLVQLGQVAAVVPGLLAAVVHRVLRRPDAAGVPVHVAADRRHHHGRRDDPRHGARDRPRPARGRAGARPRTC